MNAREYTVHFFKCIKEYRDEPDKMKKVIDDFLVDEFLADFADEAIEIAVTRRTKKSDKECYLAVLKEQIKKWTRFAKRVNHHAGESLLERDAFKMHALQHFPEFAGQL